MYASISHENNYEITNQSFIESLVKFGIDNPFQSLNMRTSMVPHVSSISGGMIKHSSMPSKKTSRSPLPGKFSRPRDPERTVSRKFSDNPSVSDNERKRKESDASVGKTPKSSRPQS